MNLGKMQLKLVDSLGKCQTFDPVNAGLVDEYGMKYSYTEIIYMIINICSWWKIMQSLMTR